MIYRTRLVHPRNRLRLDLFTEIVVVAVEVVLQELIVVKLIIILLCVLIECQMLLLLLLGIVLVETLHIGGVQSASSGTAPSIFDYSRTAEISIVSGDPRGQRDDDVILKSVV